MPRISLEPLAANLTEVHIGGHSLLFSYKTLVGLRLPNGEVLRSSTFHSRTTSKHLNQAGYRDAEEVSQEHLEGMAEMIGANK